MPITRKFISWKQPALPQAANYLADKYAQGGELNLANVIPVFPGGRAGRRFLEELVIVAEERKLILNPPQFATVGSLPEKFYESKYPFAGTLQQQLAWVKALQSMPPEALQAVLPAPPQPDDYARWFSLGQLFWRQHRELAADGLDFARVAAWQGLHAAEQQRWKTLHKVQLHYLELLDRLNLWDKQTARLYAIKHKECRTESDIVLIGTVDINTALRNMLDQVADRVTVLVHAEAEVADRFDEHGCLIPQTWEHAAILVDNQQLEVADGPVQQAEAVARSIARLEGKFRADEIVVGLPDETQVPQIQRLLAQCGVGARWVVGKQLAETGPVRLLEAITQYAAGRRFHSFAALVRHPDLYDWLCNAAKCSQWLSQLDSYIAGHLQPQPGNWLGKAEEHAVIREVHAAVGGLVKGILGEKPLSQWPAAMIRILDEVYGSKSFDRDDPAQDFTLTALSKIGQALAELQEMPAELQPEVSALEFVDILLGELAAETIPSPPAEDAIELLGWLELPLDDAPAVIVASMNEGFVPKSLNSDLFLPDKLRRQLGLDDNSRRYARDAYALTVLLHSRKKVKLILCRRDSEGAALLPSRLLFADQPEVVAKRTLALLAAPAALHPPLAGALTAGREQPGILVRRPLPLKKPVETISVTGFRSYLACPFRYYLKHVLYLAEEDDAVEELDAAAFGNIIHEVLDRFGRGKCKDSTDEQEIAEFLEVSLHNRVREIFGEELLAPVRVQMGLVQLRLNAFAAWQADWARQGWRIKFTEEDKEETRVPFPPTGPGLMLRGRIDRIDYRESTNQWIIFDYKTSSTANKPEKAHFEGGQWCDLQLPLYRHLAKPLGVEGEVQLGYIALPKDTSKVGAAIAEWTQEELADADRKAAEVVAQILAGEFWPPREPPPKYSDFAGICQENVFQPAFEHAQEAE